MCVTILAIADQASPLLYDHFRPERWSNVDIVLSCGDLPPHYLDFLATNLAVPILYVRGNHDSVYNASQYEGFEDVSGRIATCGGLRITGFEGSMRYNSGACQYSEQQMRHRLQVTRLRALRAGPPHIVMTHAPPAHCHDGRDLCHRGFESFRTAIGIWRPMFFIHGHMHAYDRGTSVSRIGTTTVVNAFPYKVIQIPALE